jgi:hypothetical protein
VFISLIRNLAMAEQHKMLSLIPVHLHEAVIDSPPFRASVRHFDDQLDTFEKWLEGYIKILTDWLMGLQRTEYVLCNAYARS